MIRRGRTFQSLSAVAFYLGLVLALPGALLIIAASWLMNQAVEREITAHDHALDLEVE